MVTVTVSNKAEILGISKEIKASIMHILTLDNPVYGMKAERNLSLWGIPKNLKFYDLIPGGIEVPIGALNDCLNIITSAGILSADIRITDLRRENKTAETSEYFDKISFLPELREYQKDVLNTLIPKTVGVVEAKTGSGKTLTFVKLILERKVPTLILVNTLELALQTKAAFINSTNLTAEDIGLIGNGKFILKPISIGLHQTLARLPEDKYDLLNNFFGQVIADEVHIVSASTYAKNMQKLATKFKFGFSATPFREDGLTDVIHFVTGPKVHKVPDEALEDILIIPKLVYINTDYCFPLLDTAEYTYMITDLSNDVDRNTLIINTLNNEYANNFSCLLCSRQSQVDILMAALSDKAVTLTSKMKKKERAAAVEQLRNKEKTIVISTYGLFSTGIDIPHLDTLFLCAPMKSYIKIKQSAGRLMRKSENKDKATIVDFVDNKIDLLNNHAKKRKKIFKNL